MPLWLTLVLALGGTALINAFISFAFASVINGTKKKQAKIKEESEERIKEVIKVELEPVNQELQGIKKILDLDKEGTVTLLRDSMKDSLDRYRDQGYATISDKAKWIETYNSYMKLGGNHFREYVDQWKLALEHLPEKEDM